MKIDEKTMIPEILIEYPQTRSVFDRYGLKGCGGQHGPAETLGFFSRAHGVDLDSLIKELNETLNKGISLPFESFQTEGVALEDRIYRRFFITAIIATLTAGATWGAYLLWKIAIAHSFTSLTVHEVNAHGHAQIFGWVALFIMGFAYQAFPRFKHSSLWRPDIANISFTLMLSGIIASVLGGILWQYPWGLIIGSAGSAAEVTAVILFATIIIRTFGIKLSKLAPFEFYILGSTFWFFIATVFSGIHFYLTTSAGTTEALIQQVATWQLPLRDIQIHGFAMLMVLGVSQRFLPGMYNFPETSSRKSIIVFSVLNLVVISEVISFVVFRLTGITYAAFALEGAAVLMFATVLWLIIPWNLWKPVPEGDRGLKFIRAAYLWLVIALALVVVMPFYNRIIGVEFSHAYFGAARHAITVGFITMMILGVASKVVPTLSGIDVRQLNPLLATFILVNLGCTLRVTSQILSDHFSGAFKVIGFSGVLEVIGITIWGIHLVRLMFYKQRAGGKTETLTGKVISGQISPDATVADVLAAVPGALDIFLDAGFTPLRNPLMGQTLARTITVGTACRHLGIDQTEFLQKLNDLGSTINNKAKKGAIE
ncbi:MAG: DUF1858 domain-containing protein [bacterium]